MMDENPSGTGSTSGGAGGRSTATPSPSHDVSHSRVPNHDMRPTEEGISLDFFFFDDVVGRGLSVRHHGFLYGCRRRVGLVVYDGVVFFRIWNQTVNSNSILECS